jgi:hypothetical protein
MSCLPEKLKGRIYFEDELTTEDREENEEQSAKR